MSRIRKLFRSAVLLLVLAPPAANAEVIVEQGHPDFEVELLAQKLGIPWGLAFLGPQQLLFSERAGKMRLLDLGDKTIVDLTGTPEVVAEGQGGLLDVAVGPNYTRDGWIYFTYSKGIGAKSATTLARARLRESRLIDRQDLLVTDSAGDSGRHFGSRIAFDDAGHVYFSVGDRGERARAQDLSNHAGSILRLNLDGSIPRDNPFVGRAGRDEIWSYGHRNPQGLFYDRASGNLWSIEHGPRGGDEINLINKGANYGWPLVSHGKEYWGPVSIGEGRRKAGIEDPRKVYIPSIAPSSLILYRGKAFPAWQGNLFAGALKLLHINRVSLSADYRALDEERLLEDLGVRIRALAEGPDGLIYLSADSGHILRLRPAP